MIFLFGILAVIFFFNILNMSKRIDTLEKKINTFNFSNTDARQPSQNIVKQLDDSALTDNEIYSPVSQNNNPEISSTDSFDPLVWFKENWLLKLGIFLFLVGFGWFVSYAFIHDWIGPVGRIVLGLGAGIISLGFGQFRMNKNSTQGKTFLVLGSALMIVTLYAGHLIYNFFSPVALLVFVFIICAYIAGMALQFNMKSIAVYGLVVAYTSPLFVVAVAQPKIFFSYLVIVSLASIWLAHIREWRDLGAVSIVGFLLHVIPYMLTINTVATTDKFFAASCIFIMCLVYFFISMYGLIRNNDTVNQGDIIIAIFNSVLIIFATYTFVDEKIMSIVLIGWMLLFMIGGYFVFRYTQKENFFYLYSLVAVVLLVFATAMELDGSALIYAYAIESAVISIAGYLVTRKLRVGYSLSALMIGPALMSLPSMFSNKWSTGIAHDDFGVLFTIGTLFIGLGLFYYFSEEEAERYNDSTDLGFYPRLLVAGSVFYLILIWLSSGTIFVEPGIAILVSLVIYTIVGISTYFYGLINEMELLKKCGGALLIFVVARLLIIDVWNMELGSRIVTFILIGGLFIATAFLGNKRRNRMNGGASE